MFKLYDFEMEKKTDENFLRFHNQSLKISVSLARIIKRFIFLKVIFINIYKLPFLVMS